jgi:hypothetical protein
MGNRTCSEPECRRRILARGLCRLHYDHLRRAGPLPSLPKKTHCKRGHPRTPDNVDRSGHCITCSRAYDRAYNEQRRRAAGIKPRAKKTHCKRGHPRTPDNVDPWGHCILCMRAYDQARRRTIKQLALAIIGGSVCALIGCGSNQRLSIHHLWPKKRYPKALRGKSPKLYLAIVRYWKRTGEAPQGLIPVHVGKCHGMMDDIRREIEAAP